MRGHLRKGLGKYFLGACLGLGLIAGPGRSDDASELRQLIEAQNKKIEELKQQLDAKPVAAPKVGGAEESEQEKGQLSDDAVKKIVADYLGENPGAGMPPSVQTGYANTNGFFIRSTNNPKYIPWQDESAIPFTLNIRGRIQLTYDYYKVTDSLNHILNTTANLPSAGTNLPAGVPDSRNTPFLNRLNRFGLPGGNSAGDFSQLEIKRMRLIFEGTVFDPNLRYHVQLDGGTRGIGALANNTYPQGVAGSTVGGGDGIATVDHAMRLFSCYVAYDFKPCCWWKGCGEDCPDGHPKYSPTLTLIGGKLKPLTGLEEYLGSANEQFVEYSMADWMFDVEDDNLQMCVGAQFKALEDRFYAVAYLTNGDESQIANGQMDRSPGGNFGFWYDFGGTWNEARHKWDLYGDCISDIDYTCHPVLRVGADCSLVPMNRRSLYTNAELGRIRGMAARPGGESFIDLLDGGGATSVVGAQNRFSADAFDAYFFNVFAAAKYKGFSFYTEAWLRDLQHFRGSRNAAGVDNAILFSAWDPATNTRFAGVFRRGHIADYGQTTQAGYFIVPKKFEIAGRFSWINGQSGSIEGNRFADAAALPVNGALSAASGQTVREVPGAFQRYQTAYEYAVGVNYYWKRQLLKWQTDFSVYQGGNPAAGGASAAGFEPGVDGWQIRTQLQLAF